MANLIDTFKTNFRQGLLQTLQSMQPYNTKEMVDLISIDNPKFRDFYNQGTKRDEILAKHSIVGGDPYGNNNHPMAGAFGSDSNFSSFMYANIEPDKIKRLREYRLMSAHDVIKNALDEICDEFIVIDEDDEIFKFDVRKENFDKQAKKTLTDEFRRFIQHFDFENKGWEYVRNYLVDGELYFENIIHEKHEDKGILGVVSMPTESMDPIFNNVQNLLVKAYLLRKPIYDPNQKVIKEVRPIVLDKNQVTYFHSDEWNDGKTFRTPHIENVRRSYKQLNMIEDSIIIHRIVHGSEKMVFNIDVGNMPPPQAERYLQQLAQKYWSRKTYDSKQGGVNMFNPQSMLDAYWFPKRQGSEGTSVTKLPNGQSLGDLPDLTYFTNKLYESMNVPVTRLTKDTTFSDGTDMLREELKFARFIIRLQRSFSETIKESFITHLKLRGWWDEYELSAPNLKVKMNEPTHFNVLRQQQIFEIQSNNYSGMANNEFVSEEFAQKEYLGWDDQKIRANREHLRKENEFRWELQQIAAYGPNWRTVQDKEAGEAGEAFGGAGGAGIPTSDLGGGESGLGDIDTEGGEGNESPPENFGPTPTTAEEPQEPNENQ